jgi:hypothetical protein
LQGFHIVREYMQRRISAHCDCSTIQKGYTVWHTQFGCSFVVHFGSLLSVTGRSQGFYHQ